MRTVAGTSFPLQYHRSQSGPVETGDGSHGEHREAIWLGGLGAGERVLEFGQ